MQRNYSDSRIKELLDDFQPGATEQKPEPSAVLMPGEMPLYREGSANHEVKNADVEGGSKPLFSADFIQGYQQECVKLLALVGEKKSQDEVRQKFETLLSTMSDLVVQNRHEIFSRKHNRFVELGIIWPLVIVPNIDGDQEGVNVIFREQIVSFQKNFQKNCLANIAVHHPEFKQGYNQTIDSAQRQVDRLNGRLRTNDCLKFLACISCPLVFCFTLGHCFGFGNPCDQEEPADCAHWARECGEAPLRHGARCTLLAPCASDDKLIEDDHECYEAIQQFGQVAARMKM